MKELWTPEDVAAQEPDKLVIGYKANDSKDPIYGIAGGADGIFYRDSRQPFLILDQTAITLATTQKALWPYPLTLLPANYWVPGKTIKLTSFGKATTDGTAGNYIFGMGYGASDAPAATTVGATTAGVVSRTNDTWMAQTYTTCRATGSGSTGTLMTHGIWTPVITLMLSTLQPYIIPATLPATNGIDTTVGTNSLVHILDRSGAGVWTTAVTGLYVEALN